MTEYRSILMLGISTSSNGLSVATGEVTKGTPDIVTWGTVGESFQLSFGGGFGLEVERMTGGLGLLLGFVAMVKIRGLVSIYGCS
jgi:hypothetical protein